MKAYFPLPPNIKISNIDQKIHGSITFLNVPNNRLKSIFFNKKYQDKVFLGIYLLKNKSWVLLKVQKGNPFEFLEITRDELNVMDEEIVVIVPQKSSSFEYVSDILPEPESLRIDNSFVAQRVSLNFSYLNGETSYQGEYPFNLANADKSSLFSFDALKGSKGKYYKNFLILINISRNNNTKDSIEIKFFNPKYKDKFRLIRARKNSITIVETNQYEKNLNDKEIIFFTSEISSFIPIFLSLDLKNNQLSVEHTHPPTEFFSGANKNYFVKLTKNQWLI